MRKVICLFAVLLLVRPAIGQHIAAFSIEDVKARASSTDTIYVINFWATWCVPCVQELPEFNNIYTSYKNQPVKILLVSLDFKDSYPYKLASFLERKGIKPEVVWLSDTDPNVFIPKIDETWGGSIPATLVIAPGRFRKFVEGEVTAGQLSNVIESLLEK